MVTVAAAPHVRKPRLKWKVENASKRLAAPPSVRRRFSR